MTVATLSSGGLASDSKSIDALRASAGRDPKAAIRETARQFEAVFMQQLMKSMRQASGPGGMLDNAGSQLGTEMLDTQLAGQMTGLPGGLAELIARQLERQMGGAAVAAGMRGGSAESAAAPAGAAGAPASGPVSARQAAFVQQHASAARAEQERSGIPAAYMVAQAAHETGWGQRQILHADGSPSHNLFGIKAGAGWGGKVAEITTTEYIDGQPRKVTARFRAYDSPEASFRDYARLIKESPRYQQVAEAASAEGFAQALQRAGYATDPAYAEKLTRTINATLRLQRMG